MSCDDVILEAVEAHDTLGESTVGVFGRYLEMLDSIISREHVYMLRSTNHEVIRETIMIKLDI